MEDLQRLRAVLAEAVLGPAEGLSAADRLCVVCVDALGVDGAAISVLDGGTTRGTFGSSGALSRHLDELQFTFGEGPCIDAVTSGRPVLTDDLDEGAVERWPAFAPAVLDAGVGAIFALPVAIARTHVAALDLFRLAPGPLSDGDLEGGLLAAEMAQLPLLDLMAGRGDWGLAAEGGNGWSELASLERVEVYQATGMIMAQLGLGAAEALVRLRAHAFGSGQTASQVAWAVVDRRLTLGDDRDSAGEVTSS